MIVSVCWNIDDRFIFLCLVFYLKFISSLAGVLSHALFFSLIKLLNLLLGQEGVKRREE